MSFSTTLLLAVSVFCGNPDNSKQFEINGLEERRLTQMRCEYSMLSCTKLRGLEFCLNAHRGE